MCEPLILQFGNSKELLEFYLGWIDRIAFLNEDCNDFALGEVKGYILAILDLERRGKDLRDSDMLEKFQSIWNLLMGAALRSLRSTKEIERDLSEEIKQGTIEKEEEKLIQELSNGLEEMFKKTIKFEDMLFGAEKFYRDHVVHSLWVYFLGEYVRSRGEQFVQMSWPEWQVTSSFAETDTFRREVASKLEAKIEVAWCIIALCHDLGYPLERVVAFNREINDLLGDLGVTAEFFRTPTAGPLWLSIAMIQQGMISNILPFASRQLCLRSDRKIRSAIYSPSYSDLCNDFPDGSHGFASAYILYNKIVNSILRKWISNSKGPIRTENLSPVKLDSSSNIVGFKMSPVEIDSLECALELQVWSSILDAIITHTCGSRKVQALDNIGSALTFLDEIEEFSRLTKYFMPRRFFANMFQIRASLSKPQKTVDIEIVLTSTRQAEETEKVFVHKIERTLRVFKVGESEGAIGKIELICRERWDKDTEFKFVMAEPRYWVHWQSLTSRGDQPAKVYIERLKDRWPKKDHDVLDRVLKLLQQAERSRMRG